MWQKYWTVVQQTFQETIHFRAELLIWVVLDTLPTIILFLVWETIFRTTTQIDGYTFSGMVEFYFYFLVITNLTGAHFEQQQVEKIRRGQIDQYLTRPLSFPEYIFWSYVGNRVFYFILLIPSLIAVAFIAQLFFHIQFSVLTVVKLESFVTLLVTSFLIEYLLALIIVMLGFWLEYAEGLEHFKWITITLLGGSIIPKIFMPSWLQTIVSWTPFQYMYSVPIDIMQGRHVLQPSELLSVLAFILGLGVLAWILWKHAVYKYTSAGG